MTLSAEGFSGEADYVAQPRVEPPAKTTRGFLPGPIRAGQWAAELVVAEGQGSGRWRLQPMRGSLIDTVSSPIRVEPGWGGVAREPCR